MADLQVKKSNGMAGEIESEDLPVSFASMLDSFAETLPKNERLLLTNIIFRLQDPIERMKWRNAASILHPNEIEILNNLESEWARK